MKLKIKCPKCNEPIEINPASEMGKLGGKSLAKSITKEQRQEWSRKGGLKRKGWKKPVTN